MPYIILYHRDIQRLCFSPTRERYARNSEHNSFQNTRGHNFRRMVKCSYRHPEGSKRLSCKRKSDEQVRVDCIVTDGWNYFLAPINFYLHKECSRWTSTIADGFNRTHRNTFLTQIATHLIQSSRTLFACKSITAETGNMMITKIKLTVVVMQLNSSYHRDVTLRFCIIPSYMHPMVEGNTY